MYVYEPTWYIQIYNIKYRNIEMSPPDIFPPIKIFIISHTGPTLQATPHLAGWSNIYQSIIFSSLKTLCFFAFQKNNVAVGHFWILQRRREWTFNIFPQPWSSMKNILHPSPKIFGTFVWRALSNNAPWLFDFVNTGKMFMFKLLDYKYLVQK